MYKFESETIDIGTRSPGCTVNVSFKILSKDSEFSHFETSCGCTTPSYNPSDDTISLNYTFPQIPYHLVDIGTSSISKQFTVYFKDGTSVPLSFHGINSSKLLQ